MERIQLTDEQMDELIERVVFNKNIKAINDTVLIDVTSTKRFWSSAGYGQTKKSLLLDKIKACKESDTPLKKIDVVDLMYCFLEYLEQKEQMR